MNLTTVNVAIPVQLLIGVPLPGGSVRFELTKADISGGALVLPKAVTVALPADGSTATAQLCPNTLGTQGSQTKFTILDQAGVEQYSGLATVPNFDCNLPDIITSLAPSTVTDAQAAVNLARAWAVQDPTPVDGVDYSARHHALAAKADRQQADLDAAATAGDRIQTGQDVISANAARDQANTARDQSNTARDTAIAQASLAAGYAAGAGSVSQQDLSGVTAAALHRSPNAVTSLFVYDTSKDSDGGAWVDRMADRSWMTEVLNGKWLGAQANEAAARGVSGAATGDYFQLTTDGKFYRLNAGAGTTEVFRGNVAKFPRLAAIVAEAARVVIYDLTNPGRPMWMVFVRSSTGVAETILSFSGTSVSSVYALGGVLSVGLGTLGLALVNFAADRAEYKTGALSLVRLGTIAQRNVENTLRGLGNGGGLLVNATVNVVAMTVQPDAPVDPVTGLQAPTIAAHTTGGVSVVKQDGSVSSHAFTGTPAFDSLMFSAGWLVYGHANGVAGPRIIRVADITGSTFIGSSYANPSVATGLRTLGCAGTVRGAIAAMGAAAGTQGTTGFNSVNLLRVNPGNLPATLRADITPTYNTGWMAGDIRRALLCDTVAGNVTDAELVTNGAFAADLSGWTITNAGGSTTAWGAGAAVMTGDGANTARLSQSFATVAGVTYRLTYDTTTNPVALAVGTVVNGFDLLNAGTGGVGAGQSYSFIGTGGVVFVTFLRSSIGSANLDNVSVKAAALDRSYKAKPSAVVGTLTKSAVGVGSQLVAYSSFSAANYLQEAYSADLDPATGAVFVPFLGTIPANVAAAGWAFDRSAAAGAFYKGGHDATGKLTCSFSDGTATRTATTAAAYNTGLPISGGFLYETSGTVSIIVNGKRVASTTGTPLGSLTNAAATFTVGIDRGLTAPWAGSLALLKVGMTVPSDTAMDWVYQQEKQMFQAGAQITLPDSGNVVDLSYDDRLDQFLTATAANESAFRGLVRVSFAPVAAGSISKIAGTTGAKLLARTTTSPGVDVTLPAQNLKEELLRRAEDAARAQRAAPRVFDFDATVSQTDFPLQPGYEAMEVIAARSSQREGAAKDWQRKFDGFQETASMNTGQALNTWVQVIARRTA